MIPQNTRFPNNPDMFALIAIAAYMVLLLVMIYMLVKVDQWTRELNEVAETLKPLLKKLVEQECSEKSDDYT
jgi:abortive infection bacteriophage resistance protein